MSNVVLAAVDLTHEADSITLVQRAAQLAALDGADLAVVTVVPDFGMSLVGSYFKEGAEHDAMDMAAKSLHNLTSKAVGDTSQIQHMVQHGNAYDEILSAAKTVEAGLIVIGAHRPDLHDYLIGPNAARVVRHATASVLVMRIKG